jgi:hypothetical protein
MLTEKKIKEYRDKLNNSEYMKAAINGIAKNLIEKNADKISEVITEVDIPYVKLNKSMEEKKMARLTLNDHLLEMLEWVGDQSVKGDDLKEQVMRAETKSKLAQQIIANNNLMFRAIQFAHNNGIDIKVTREKLKFLTE